jgi:hypothetical protein
MTVHQPRKPIVIEGSTNSPDRSYWLSHPDVTSASFVADQTEDGKPTYNLMLLLVPPPDESDMPGPPTIHDGARAPEREPDLTLFVAGEPNSPFINRLPNLEFMEAYQEGMSHEEAPNGWWFLRLWVRGRAG